MKITITETTPQPAERPYPKFRRSTQGTVVFFTSPSTGLSSDGTYSDGWNKLSFTDCDQDGNDLPELEVKELPFPKVMKYTYAYANSGCQVLLLCNHEERTVIYKYPTDEANGDIVCAHWPKNDYLPGKFEDFHGTIQITQP